MTRLLVLGATGRIGAILRRAEPPQGLTPIWHSRKPGQLPGAVAWDMTQPPPALAADIVLSLAGGRTEPLSLNTDLALASLRAAQAAGARHTFLASSGAVYGHGPYHEDAPPAPANPYGQAKADMERVVLDATGGAGLTILRIGNIAGADALLGPGPRDVTLDRPADGPLSRSYIGPGRLAEMLFTLAMKAARGEALPTILNIALAPSVAMADLVRAIGWPLTEVPGPEGLPANVALDTDRLAALGLSPETRASAADIVADLCASDPRFAPAL